MAPSGPPTASQHHAPQVSDNVVDVYTGLALWGPCSRVNLARRLGLSQTSVSRIVDRLLRAELLVEGERVSTGAGRPQTLLHQNAAAAVVAGVSVRSRFVRVYLADLGGSGLVRLERERTDESAHALVEQIAGAVHQARREARPDAPVAAVTLGLSGVWNTAAREVQSAPNLRILEGWDVQALLRDSLHETRATGDPEPDASVDNDVNLAALGEGAHGAAQEVEDFFYLNLGSGVGGAAVTQGQVQRGAQGFAGEVGYLPIAVEGSVQPLEDLLRRDALVARARTLGLAIEHGNVDDLLAEDEAGGGRLAAFVSHALGQALVAVVATLDPRLIVLGGAIGRHGAGWTERIRATLAHFLPFVPTVVPTAIGPEASLLGAVDHARAAARRVVLGQIREAA